MSTGVYILTICLFIGTVLTVFGMKYMFASASARARAEGDEAYQALAARAVAFQGETRTTLAEMAGEMSAMAARLAEVERVLKEVE